MRYLLEQTNNGMRIFSKKRNGTAIKLRKSLTQKYAKCLWNYSILADKNLEHNNMDTVVEDEKEKKQGSSLINHILIQL